jgi:hypothetical protein
VSQKFIIEERLQFEVDWAEKLKDPAPGKPPLKKFHLSNCNARKGEFASYNRTEQNFVIREFRQIIINARLTSVASRAIH